MFQNFYPNKLIRSVYELDWEELSRTYGGVIFDIDNTLVPHGAAADQRLAHHGELHELLAREGAVEQFVEPVDGGGRRGGDPAFCPDPRPWHEDHAGIQQRRSAGKAFCTAGTD